MRLASLRVSKAEYGPTIASGAGAAEWGGRWNSRDRALVHDRRMLYTSATLTLAMLEVLTHVTDSAIFAASEHAYVRLSFDEAAVAELTAEHLPRGWDALPETTASQAIGNDWYDRQASVVLRVPSVVVTPQLRPDPAHSNYLINVRHPDFARAVRVEPVERLVWDGRLKPSGQP